MSNKKLTEGGLVI